ncbi:MAG: alpha/beta fold hydrolase [Gammaproteobacteria bacterium]|nr:alpha/beta fold hydrolase [Gammaproteobacteria bacterium]
MANSPKHTFSELPDKLGSLFSKMSSSVKPRGKDAELLMPRHSDTQTSRVPKGIEQMGIKSQQGDIHAYKTGRGPLVLLVHGWGGGAHQFFPLMLGLAQCGFTALSFDHMGHGLSEKKAATLKQFILTTNHLLDFATRKSPEGLYAIIAHSTGCVAVANGIEKLVREKPLFLIAPVFNYPQHYRNVLKKLKLGSKLESHYLEEFKKNYKSQYQKYELATKLEKYADLTVIAHDKNDNENSAEDSIQFCATHPLTRLLITTDYDHLRIINSESVWQELKSHLNYEDTSINFMDQFHGK